LENCGGGPKPSQEKKWVWGKKNLRLFKIFGGGLSGKKMKNLMETTKYITQIPLTK